MVKILMALAVLVMLSGCQYLGLAQEYSAKGIGYLYIAECAASLDTRRSNALAVQQELVRQGHDGRVVAQDCNADGEPDFLLTSVPLPE